MSACIIAPGGTSGKGYKTVVRDGKRVYAHRSTEDVRAIREGAGTQCEKAARFGVSKSQIGRIMSGEQRSAA